MKKKFKIIHTTCHTSWGGQEKRIINESLWMRKKGHDVVIVAPAHSSVLKRASKHDLKTYSTEFNWSNILNSYRQLAQIYLNEKPDILNTHGNQDAKIALSVGARNKIPLKILSRHISSPVKPSWYNKIIYNNLCHSIFTTADYTKAHLQKTFSLEDSKIYSMPSGIVVPEYLPNKDKARQELIEECTIDNDSNIIGYIGRVAKEKGIESLLSAYNQIKPKLPKTDLVIAGTGSKDYVAHLKKMSLNHEANGSIHFVGFKENIWQYHRAIDLLVLPSLELNGEPFEGVPQSVLEAMYCECPVIASDTGGIKDIVRPQKTGRLFKPNEPTDIAYKILETFDEEQKTLFFIENAKMMVEQHHTIDVMGEKTCKIYESFLG